ANDEAAAKPNDPDAGGYIAANLGFVRTGATYKRKIEHDLWTVAPMLGTNILTLHTIDYHATDVADVVDISRRWYLFGGRAEWLRDDANGFLHAGLDVDGGYLGRVDQQDLGRDNEDAPFPRNTVLWADAAVFVETRRQWYGDKVSVRPG